MADTDSTRVCRACGIIKPIEDFSPSNRGKGYVHWTHKCKSCLNEIQTERRARDLEKSRRQARETYHRRKGKYRDYERQRRATDPSWPQRKAVQRGRVKLNANAVVFKAVRDGMLIRPDKCQDCGMPCKPHGHHKDYAKPLEVVWVCTKCHGIRHRKPTSEAS